MAIHTIEVVCRTCGRVLHIADTYAGQAGKCTHCGAEIAVPNSAEVPVEDIEKAYWFYAKQYGYGWGLPACWQGWVVFVGFIVLLFAGAPLLNVANGPGLFLAYQCVLIVILIAICWAKGEPLAWRWGERTVDTRAAYSTSAREVNSRGYLVFHVFMGPLMLVLGCWLYSSPPAHMNQTYGYRTEASYQSQEAWDEAQRFSAKTLIAVALVIILCQGITIFTMKPALSLIVSTVLMVIGVVTVVPITESHLKGHFDAHGSRITQQADRR